MPENSVFISAATMWTGKSESVRFRLTIIISPTSLVREIPH